LTIIARADTKTENGSSVKEKNVAANKHLSLMGQINPPRMTTGSPFVTRFSPATNWKNVAWPPIHTFASAPLFSHEAKTKRPSNKIDEGPGHLGLNSLTDTKSPTGTLIKFGKKSAAVDLMTNTENENVNIPVASSSSTAVATGKRVEQIWDNTAKSYLNSFYLFVKIVLSFVQIFVRTQSSDHPNWDIDHGKIFFCPSRRCSFCPSR
jgi:hypothetical protein